MKAQKKASERNTAKHWLEQWGRTMSVRWLHTKLHKLRLYLKQDNLQVSRGKATLVARVLRYVRAAQQILEPETMTQLVTLSCNLVTQKIQTT